MEKSEEIEVSYSSFKGIMQHLDTLPWENIVDYRDIYDIASKNFPALCVGCTKNRRLIRLCGQSGSGKTTQLLPAAKALFDAKKIVPINFCVRNFAVLHPKYKNWLEEFGESTIRERTNGFALRCLLISLILAISQGYDIIFEVTLLSTEFEKFVNKFLQKFNYNVLYLCVAINKELSDEFVAKRQNDKNSKERGRVVSKNSTDFFESSLRPALEMLSVSGQNNDRIIIWNAFEMKPKYDGEILGCLQVFETEKNIVRFVATNEQTLRQSKIDYLLKNI